MQLKKLFPATSGKGGGSLLSGEGGRYVRGVATFGISTSRYKKLKLISGDRYFRVRYYRTGSVSTTSSMSERSKPTKS